VTASGRPVDPTAASAAQRPDSYRLRPLHTLHDVKVDPLALLKAPEATKREGRLDGRGSRTRKPSTAGSRKLAARLAHSRLSHVRYE
jgi:hypothetical protein